MKISIITVCYNSSLTILDTINSVNIQTYPYIEHVFIDGNSNDGSVEIIKNNCIREKKIISEKDKGLYYAMNKGVKMATGDIIGILNSDDIYANNNVISSVINNIKKFKVDSLYGNLVYTKSDNLNKIVRYWKSGPYKRKNFLLGWMPPHPTFFIKKKIYTKYGKFNTELKSSADYEIMLRFLYKHKISTIYLNQILVKMRSGGHSNKNIFSRLKGNKEDRLAWKLNEIEPLPFTFLLKPSLKIFQFILKPSLIKH